MKSVDTKVCTKCGEDKSLDDYYKMSKASDGKRPECKSCIRLANKAYYKENSEAMKLNARTWMVNNPERKRETQRKYRAKNPHVHRESRKRFRAKNPGKTNAFTAERRAAKKQATPTWYDKQEVNYIYQLASERGLEVDHIVPLKSDSVCGLHVQDNLRCISTELNQHKGNRYWPDMWKQ